MDLAELVGSFLLRRWFLPKPLATAWAVWSYRKFLFEGLKSLANGRLDVPVLDAAAIGISFLKRDPRTAGTTMLAAQSSARRSRNTRAARSEACAYQRASWTCPNPLSLIEGEHRGCRCPPNTLKPQVELIAVRTGMPVCVDGVVVQRMRHGQPGGADRRAFGRGTHGRRRRVRRHRGGRWRDHSCEVKANDGRHEAALHRVNLVEQTETYKSETQSRIASIWPTASCRGTSCLPASWPLTTRSLVKTSAALMVDYSCALKLTGFHRRVVRHEPSRRSPASP